MVCVLVWLVAVTAFGGRALVSVLKGLQVLVLCALMAGITARDGVRVYVVCMQEGVLQLQRFAFHVCMSATALSSIQTCLWWWWGNSQGLGSHAHACGFVLVWLR